MADLLDPFPTELAVGIVVVLAVVVALLVTLSRVKGRKRRELFATATDAIDTLLVAPLRADVGDLDERSRADQVNEATETARGSLVDLERASRFETSAAAGALLRHAAELGEVLEQRLRGEGDPYLLEVRITELRERVRGARDRLAAAIRD